MSQQPPYAAPRCSTRSTGPPRRFDRSSDARRRALYQKGWRSLAGATWTTDRTRRRHRHPVPWELRMPAHPNVMFTRHGLRAGVRQVNPHRFRHTFATWAIRVNARELDVPVFAWSRKPDDGPALLRDLRLRAGGGSARYLQPGDAAVGEVRRGGRPTSHLPGIHLSLNDRAVCRSLLA